ncbi:hypothetical protein CHS0354_014938 [Potamilus streckersoni]|uniref:Uncharacterized protein n=1 Tax=Potamilus streckersoni TaxID=2493646 RepID=A0AAE0VQP6_9BIVA|nr:hypothetical protein CHS0354_014938 [Potamilus streckersoni]
MGSVDWKFRQRSIATIRRFIHTVKAPNLCYTSRCPFRFRHLDDVTEDDDSVKRQEELEHHLRFQNLPPEQREIVDKLLRGGLPLEKLPNLRPKVVRMFVCSLGLGRVSRIIFF